MNNRRQFMKKAGAAGALAAVLGYSHTTERFLKGALYRTGAADPYTGNAPQPEYRVDPVSGAVQLNAAQQVSYSTCMGCTTLCGVRVRIDKGSDTVLRVTGNPYHVLSADPHLPYETPVLESFAALSRFQERGLDGRATACARGNAVLAKLDSPNRVRVPLKRIGARGAGKWAPISFEQLVKEVVEGGDLFGEGHVDGLRAIRDIGTPLDPAQPELGPKSNQLVVMAGFDDGRLAFAKRFAINSFGTINFGGHGAYCGLSMRSGYAALLGDWKKHPHLKPDYANAEFLIFIGTAPGNAGKPFQRTGHLVAKGRSRGLKYVVVDPVLTDSDNIAADSNTRWIGIRPNTDAALAMAMIRWIFDHDAFDGAFLANPNPKAAETAGEASWSNATHLVIVEAGPDYGRMLRGSDLGLNPPGDEDPMMVIGPNGKPVPHKAAPKGELFYEGRVKLTTGNEVAITTSIALLRAAAREHTMAEYAEACGIPEATIADLAREFTSHGKHAAVDTHGGTMGSNGFYAAYAIVMLNALIGNLNVKGGTGTGGGKFNAVAEGPRYNLAAFAGMLEKPKGVGLGRNHFPYEKTTEFKGKQAAGKPYPSREPWFPLTPNPTSEFLPAALNGYPYRAKALILWSANPVYGVPGHGQLRKQLADPKLLPLFVSVDPFINETNAYADYIVPDSVLYESWGWAATWGAYLTKTSSARWPVVEPRQARNAEGNSMDMETFFIAVAKQLKLPGFGAGAIADNAGNVHPLDRAEDFYLRGGANIAFEGAPVPDADDEEIAAAGVTRVLSSLRAVLKEDEWRKVAYLYARGGRFENPGQAYEGELLRKRYPKAMQLYNEQLAKARNSLTGKHYRGMPYWQPPVLADGSPLEKAYPRKEWPLRAVSTKSQLQSAHSIGLPRLQQIQPVNPIILHQADAEAAGVRTGDRIRVVSPGGAIEGIASVRRGIKQGTVGIEYGWGHRELGAHRQRVVHGSSLAAVAGAGFGVAYNDLGCPDPKRPGISTITDFVIGSVARQGLPVRIERI